MFYRDRWINLGGLTETIEKAIQKPNKVKHLHLTYPEYDLNDYGKAFASFVNLKSLTIHTDFDYKYDLPKEIGQLPKLKKLYFLNFPFSEIPEWLFTMTNLKSLMIRGNYLTEIPDKITALKNLKYLRFENTDITTLPDCMKELTHLKSISLVANLKLTNINYNMLPPNLKYLSVSYSGVPEELKKEIKQHHPHLELKKRLD